MAILAGLSLLLSSSPLALDGDSVSAGNGAAIGAISVASIIGGYLLLAGIWYFGFRQKPRKPRKRKGKGNGGDEQL
jgi:hypothetical protein